MADRNFTDMQALDKGVKVLSGSVVAPVSGAALTNNAILGATVARTGAGAYTITLADKYPELLGISIMVAKATAQDLVPQIVAVDVASAKTITWKLLTGTTATDPTTESATFYITMILKNSTIAP